MREKKRKQTTLGNKKQKPFPRNGKEERCGSSKEGNKNPEKREQASKKEIPG